MGSFKIHELADLRSDDSVSHGGVTQCDSHCKAFTSFINDTLFWISNGI